VEVTFKEIIDDDSESPTFTNMRPFSLGRTVFKDAKIVKNKKVASSVYYYDKEVKPLKEIKEVLAKYNIDINTGRFIILQFEVKNIAEMPPKSPKE